MEHTTADTESSQEYLLEIVPEADARLRRLYAGAVKDAGLLATDFYTLRDWLEATKYEKVHSLHALIVLLMVVLDEGSLCLHLTEDNCTCRLGEFLSQEDARYWGKKIVADLAQHDFSRLIGTADKCVTPLVRAEIDGQSMLFFQKFARQEKKLLEAFGRRLSPGSSLPNALPAERIALVLKDVLERNPLRRAGEPLRLDPDQLTALGLALLRPMVTISGGPGTGKTSLVLSLLRCLTRCGIAPERIALAAPTGRAAQRLGDSLRAGIQSLGSDAPAEDQAIGQIAPTTLHQLLSYVPSTGHFRRHPENLISADVVIVDEVSMIGLTMMWQLLHGLAPDARLVLLGDKEQLPSVEAGAVLSHLLPENFEPSFSPEVVARLRSWFAGLTLRSVLESTKGQPLQDAVALLRTNHRSETRIQDAARAVNAGSVEIVDELPRLVFDAAKTKEKVWHAVAEQGGCHLLPCVKGDANELRSMLAGWARHCLADAAAERESYPWLARSCVLNAGDQYDEKALGDLRALFALVEKSRLLTLVREGPWGCVDINRFLEQQLMELHKLSRSGKFVVGSPVLITRNDHVRKLFNGDVGIALAGANSGARVVFPRGDGFQSFDAETLTGHELGFALTVHKSQGSEYDQVLLVFPPEGAKRLLSRELVYTAITRAKKLAVLFGKEEVIRQAIERRIQRESGWLRLLHAAP